MGWTVVSRSKKQRKRTKEVKKDVMGWTVVSRSKKQRKRTYQIFVKVDGTPEDKIQKIRNTMSGSDQDVFTMCEGRMHRKDDELKSGGVGDGSTTQFVSRLWRGGRHKDKKGEAEKKQVTRQEQVSNESPAILESEKDAAKIIKMILEEYGMQCLKAELHQKLWMNEEQMKVMECGVRWAVEARRKGARKKKRRQEEQGQNSGQEQGKQMRFGQEEQREENESGEHRRAEGNG